MRQAGQAKLGFYPAHPEAIAGILGHLAMPSAKASEVNILDPCAGEGKALQQIAEGLGVVGDRVYAVELDAERTEACRANLPAGAHVLGPASFLGVQITGFSYGLVYCNPPFDDELGGGRREEMAFAERAARLLVPKGILVLVVPRTALAGNRTFCDFLDSYFEDIRIYQFPAQCQPYKEIAVFARRRKSEIPTDAVQQFGSLRQMEFSWRDYGWENKLPRLGERWPVILRGQVARYETERAIYVIPPAWKPGTFRKISYTEAELGEVLARSPLNLLLREIPVQPPKRPPLPLGKGHVALLLASGMLDGLVSTPEGAHVVRGTAKKVDYVSERSSTENEETGAVTEKVVISQKIVLTIRAVDNTGEIKTFSDEPKDKEDDDTNEVMDDEEAA